MPLITGSRPDPSGVPETSRHVVLGLLPGSTGFCVPFLRRSAVGFLDSSPLGGRLRGPGSRSEGFLWRARRLSCTWNGRQLKFLYPLIYLWIRSENKQKISEKLKSQRVLPERPEEIVLK